MSGSTMTTAANGKFQSRLARQRDYPCYIVRVCDPYDDSGATIDPTVEDGASLVILGVVRCDHVTLKGSAKLWDRDHFFFVFNWHSILPWLIEFNVRVRPMLDEVAP